MTPTISGNANVIGSLQMAAEGALPTSDQDYRFLIDNQTDLVVKLDRRGYLQFVSPSYCQMYSRSDTDLLGTPFNRQIHHDDLNKVEGEWRKLHAEPWTSQFEHRAMTEKGCRWLGWSLKAIRNDAGQMVEIVGVGRDVTHRRKVEEQASVNLNALAHAGRMRSMGEMATALAHELNQPLAAILSFSQAGQRVVKKQNFDRDELVFALERIAVNAKRAGDIISQIRGFIRKEEPRAEISSINRLISDAMELVTSELLHLDVNAELHLTEPLPEVSVAPIQIQQVILNLVRNSMEAIQSRKVDERHITIATQINRPGIIEVTVSDSGPGLAPEIQESLFDAFVTTKANGLGVGLSICNSIIEAHGGRLTTRQVSGQGAAFSFTLPTASDGGEK